MHGPLILKLQVFELHLVLSCAASQAAQLSYFIVKTQKEPQPGEYHFPCAFCNIPSAP